LRGAWMIESAPHLHNVRCRHLLVSSRQGSENPRQDASGDARPLVAQRGPRAHDANPFLRPA
jgi:hypothetical protein